MEANAKITNVVVEGIDHRDAPDYCDAYIASCEIDGREATEEEIEELNQDGDFVYESVMKQLY